MSIADLKCGICGSEYIDTSCRLIKHLTRPGEQPLIRYDKSVACTECKNEWHSVNSESADMSGLFQSFKRKNLFGMSEESNDRVSAIRYTPGDTLIKWSEFVNVAGKAIEGDRYHIKQDSMPSHDDAPKFGGLSCRLSVNILGEGWLLYCRNNIVSVQRTDYRPANTNNVVYGP